MGRKSAIVRTSAQLTSLKSFVNKVVANGLKGKDHVYAARVAKTILAESERYELDPVFLLAVIENESSFQVHVVGTSGEIGLMQITPATAQWVGHKYSIHYRNARSLHDPITNVKIGAAYLSHLREHFDFESQLYISAYNMGMGHLRKALNKQIRPSEYACRVMRRYVRLYKEIKKDLVTA
jgi:soluble lytic murein transglycosylase